MNRKNIISFFTKVICVFIIMCPALSYAAPMPSVFILPIHLTKNKNFNMRVSVPNNLYTKHEYFTAFAKGQSPILEFIPHGQKFDNWTKIYTIHSIVGKKITAYKLITRIIHLFKNNTKKFTTVKKENMLLEGMQIVVSAHQYMNNDGSVELVYMRYFSGHSDLAGVQCTVKLKSWLNKADAEAFVDKISDDVRNFVDVFNAHN